MHTLEHLDLGTLKVSGKDALTFLQGQLTADLRELAPGRRQLAAFCNRQGRVLALMEVFRLEDDYYLSFPMELLESIQVLLQKYIVASKVVIENYSEFYRATWDENYLLTQMRAKVPVIGLEQSGKFLPHPLGLVALGVVSFKKGCFVGQEIIARMQHRGTLKTQLQYCEQTLDEIPAAGESFILSDGQTATLVNALCLEPKRYALLVIASKE